MEIKSIEFEFHNDEGGYSRRKHSRWKYNLTISLLLGVFIALLGHWFFAIVIASGFYMVQDFKGLRDNRFFVNSIVSDGLVVKILYHKEDVQNEIEIPLNEIRLKKKFAMESIANPYLLIYRNKELIIKQFSTGDWTMQMMDGVIREIEMLQKEQADC